MRSRRKTNLSILKALTKQLTIDDKQNETIDDNQKETPLAKDLPLKHKKRARGVPKKALIDTSRLLSV